MTVGLLRRSLGGMASHVADQRRLLTLGRIDRVRIQVGYRSRPDGPAYEHFLLDLAPSESVDPLDEDVVLTALEPVLYAGSDAPLHYSLHHHRWHTSWGASPGELEIGLLVTTGSLRASTAEGVARAFGELLSLAGSEPAASIERATALPAARRSVATAYTVDPETLSISAEEHRHADNAWAVGVRAAAGVEYDVLVGVVGGCASAVRVRRDDRTEVSDSVGS